MLQIFSSTFPRINKTYSDKINDGFLLEEIYLKSWIDAWRFISKTNEEGIEDSQYWEYYPAHDDNKDA